MRQPVKSRGKNNVAESNAITPIVAIGASAGGLEAMLVLLDNLASDTGFAFVYLQHLSADHESQLSSVLSHHTKMKVVEVTQNVVPKPNTIYVLSPATDLIIESGEIVISKRNRNSMLHLPIDRFFNSLAENHTGGMIGLILSGSAFDGTIGLKAIKSAGGITFAQDGSAKFKSMPQSVISAGVVDKILSPAQMAEELSDLAKHTEQLERIINPDELDFEEAPVGDVLAIISLIKKNMMVDFSHYKINTIRRRMVRRMVFNRLTTLEQYREYIKKNSEELKLLYNDMLINVTSFFRDTGAWEYLKTSVIPQLIKGKERGEPLRFWVCACSTGEEAYTLAMITSELLSELGLNIPVQIFASDIHEKAISKARIGFYSKSEVVNMEPKRLQQFFTVVDGGYRISKTIRDMCVFAPHNLFRDPPFARLDLVSCCNLLIYLEPVLQEKMMSIFHYSLNQSGYLMLGKSESIGNSTHLFSPVGKGYKIFMRTNLRTDNMGTLAIPDRLPGRITTETIKKLSVVERKPDQLERKVDELLLQEYTPASVVVNTDLEIIHFKGDTGKFLEPARGRATFNLLKMARPGLEFELRSIIQKVNKTNEIVIKRDIEIKYHNKPLFVTVEARPINLDDVRLCLIVFKETVKESEGANKEFLESDRVKKLEEELKTIREDIRAMVEDQESSNEELQSANEEIVSSNEELQSINEELETSKEELESSNEELMTINQEMHTRNDQLAEAYDYSEAIFGTIRESLIILDSDLRIKTANRAFFTTFKVIPDETEGRHIYDLGNGQWNIPALRELLEDIIPRDNHFQGYEVNHTFPVIGEKNMLLNGRKIVQKIHQKEMILLAIEDITEHKAGERATKEAGTKIKIILESIPHMAWLTDENGKLDFINRAFADYTGLNHKNFKTENPIEYMNAEDYDNLKPQWVTSLFAGKTFEGTARYKRASDNAYRWHHISISPVEVGGKTNASVGTATDIHDYKMLNEDLENQVADRTRSLEIVNAELTRSNGELASFSYAASHDLQEPLRKIQTFARRITEDQKNELSDVSKDYFNRISNAAKRMQQLILDLLAYSRANHEGQKLEAVNLNDLVKEVKHELRDSLSQKNGTISYSELPTVNAILFQFRQLFLNIICNAIKFAKADVPLRIEITNEVIKGNLIKHPHADIKKSYYWISISDNGMGFEKEFNDKVFNLFIKLHSKDEYSGTGIGLALCKRIMDTHKGIITANGVPSVGATFNLYLPVN